MRWNSITNDVYCYLYLAHRTNWRQSSNQHADYTLTHYAILGWDWLWKYYSGHWIHFEIDAACIYNHYSNDYWLNTKRKPLSHLATSCNGITYTHGKGGGRWEWGCTRSSRTSRRTGVIYSDFMPSCLSSRSTGFLFDVSSTCIIERQLTARGELAKTSCIDSWYGSCRSQGACTDRL